MQHSVDGCPNCRVHKGQTVAMVVLCWLVQWTDRIPINAVFTFRSGVTDNSWCIMDNTMLIELSLVSLLSLLEVRSPIPHTLLYYVVSTFKYFSAIIIIIEKWAKSRSSGTNTLLIHVSLGMSRVQVEQLWHQDGSKQTISKMHSTRSSKYNYLKEFVLF